MDPATFATSIASQGLLGVLLVIVGWVAWRKDRELQAERLARVTDAKDYTNLALSLHKQVLDAVGKLSDILDEVKKMVPTRSSFGGGR